MICTFHHIFTTFSAVLPLYSEYYYIFGCFALLITFVLHFQHVLAIQLSAFRCIFYRKCNFSSIISILLEDFRRVKSQAPYISSTQVIPQNDRLSPVTRALTYLGGNYSFWICASTTPTRSKVWSFFFNLRFLKVWEKTKFSKTHSQTNVLAEAIRWRRNVIFGLKTLPSLCWTYDLQRPPAKSPTTTRPPGHSQNFSVLEFLVSARGIDTSTGHWSSKAATASSARGEATSTIEIHRVSSTIILLLLLFLFRRIFGALFLKNRTSHRHKWYLKTSGSAPWRVLFLFSAKFQFLAPPGAKNYPFLTLRLHYFHTQQILDFLF